MQCPKHPKKKNLITSTPFAPPVCYICIRDNTETNNKIVPLFSGKSISLKGGKTQEEYRQMINANKQRFIETGVGKCKFHGEHTDFKFKKQKKVADTLICNICYKEQHKKITGVKYKQFIETGKTTCMHHGEHSKFSIVKKDTGKFSVRCLVCYMEKDRPKYIRTTYDDKERYCEKHNTHTQFRIAEYELNGKITTKIKCVLCINEKRRKKRKTT